MYYITKLLISIAKHYSCNHNHNNVVRGHVKAANNSHFVTGKFPQHTLNPGG